MAKFIDKSLGNSPSMQLVQKKNRPETFPFIARISWIALAVSWSVKYFFAPNCPWFWKCWRKEEERHLRRVLLFKQMQKGKNPHKSTTKKSVPDITYTEWRIMLEVVHILYYITKNKLYLKLLRMLETTCYLKTLLQPELNKQSELPSGGESGW